MTLRKKVIFIVAAFVVAGVALTGCVSLMTRLQSGPRDYLVGWFKMQGDDTIIPVFKIKGTYYSVSWPGAEVPLKECPGGLEWAITPSSMEGTKIIFDELSSNSYYIAIKDAQVSGFSGGKYGVGEKQPLTRIDKPAGFLDAKASRPHTNDDFIGWYQPVWLPFIRFEVRKDVDKFLVTEQEFDDLGGLWKPEEEPRELKALPNRLGFVMYERERVNLTYNESLERFELTMEDSKHQLRIPLARIPSPPSPGADAVPLPMMRIGIPCWH